MLVPWDYSQQILAVRDLGVSRGPRGAHDVAHYAGERYKRTYGVEFNWRVGKNFKLEASGYYRVYDFESVVSFHEPIAGRKTLETVNGRLFATYKLAWDLTLILQYNYRDVDSSDTRIAYDRSQYVFGVRWDY